MPKGVNKAIIIGHLGQDPDVRYMPDGAAVANISVATDESYKDKQSGQMVPQTEWHRVVMFRRLGEIAGEYLKKGSKVYIEGRLKTRSWEKDGVKRYSTEIVANELQMLDGKSDNGQQQQPPQQSQPQPQPEQGGDFDDDIPFKPLNASVY